MLRKGYTKEQIVRTLREAEGGQKVADLCRELGISPPGVLNRKRRFARLGLTEQWQRRRSVLAFGADQPEEPGHERCFRDLHRWIERLSRSH
jgi:Mn-dependent DtxR family transcriptional regulator